ncbi:MAG TPA: hypothetical protein VFK32_00090 [Tepidiformaceae bacterium]|nr:hypothetical protein [Tepidiformaceae bacterium]
MKIWELHALQIGPDAIVTTPDDEALIDGLVLTERAYLLAVRDFRPAQLVALVRAEGPERAAALLTRHFESEESRNAAGGRSLVVGRGRTPGPLVLRSDEVELPVPSRTGGPA